MTADPALTASTGGDPPPVVRVDGVSKRFGATQALRDARLSVRPGDVHALVGRNGAGKSTLVSILTGLQPADAGTVQFYGRPAPALSDRSAWRSTVACVYQRLTVIDQLSVAENLFLNRQSESGRPISWRELRSRASRLLSEWNIDVDPLAEAGRLTVEQRQLLEIARALSFGARFVILDEPTARLDAGGIGRLFGRVRALQEQGVTFLFISHHLQEVFEICQRVTVFRDARHIRSADVAGISHAELVEAMTGEAARTVTDLRPSVPASAPPLLSVRALAGESFRDVSFQVRAGEIVGLAGGGASGKFGVAETIVGLRRPDQGEVVVDGTSARPGSVAGALSAGIGFVPQDRQAEGFVGGLSVGENLTMTVPHRLGRFGVIPPAQRNAFAGKLIRQLDIVPPRVDQPAGELSGGNQQKVVAGRALADEPQVLVLMSPTAGVDVKSKESLMSAATQAAQRGAGVLVVTDDLEDLRYCHRVVVLFRGRIVTEVKDSWDDRELVSAMEGVERGDR